MQLLNVQGHGQGYSLLGWVVKLIFPGPVEAFLDPRVCPEPHHSWQQLWREGLCVLHPTYDIADHLGISLQRKETRAHIDAYGSTWSQRFQKQFTKAPGVKRLCFSGWGFSIHAERAKGGWRKEITRKKIVCAIHLVSTSISIQQTKQSALHMWNFMGTDRNSYMYKDI